MAETKDELTSKKENGFKPAQYKIDWVNAVFTAIEGSKKIWEPSVEPQIAHNMNNPDKVTKMFGMNNLLAIAALENADSKVNSFVTLNSIDAYNKNYRTHPENEKNTEKRPHKGNKFNGILLFENLNARYNEDDAEVKNGKAKAGDRRYDQNGYAEPDFRISYILPADKISLVPMVPDVDENGQPKLRKENEMAFDYKGNPVTYSNDGEYTVKGKIFAYKAGDQVVSHHEGSVIMIPDWKNSKTISTEKIPEKASINPEVEIPEPKNSHIRQTMINTFAKLIRGMEYGNYEGTKRPSNETFAKAREFYLEYPNDLFNDFRIANTYAKGNKEQIKHMEEKYNEKIAANNSTNTSTENESKKKGRKI